MTEIHQELTQIVDTLEGLVERSRKEEIQRPLDRTKQAAEQVAKAWSDSWIGYHANVYYRHFQPPPPGAHFSKAWGLKNPSFDTGSTGDWVQYDPEDVKAAIYRYAGDASLESARTFAAEANTEFLKQQRTLLSIFEAAIGDSLSPFLTKLKEEAEKLKVLNGNHFLQSLKPGYHLQMYDEIAATQGTKIPPHLQVLSEVYAIQNTIKNAAGLSEITRQLESHISRRHRHQRTSSANTRVFIGHGHSTIWRELKDFLQDRLGLLVDEYNRVPTAGITTANRLSAMMDSAGIAFLVMTGEDEQSDGQLRSRENVVHEAGLFQGRLGFERAIILLEESCEEFSNIAGLGQIRFPRGNISAKFEEIRMVLEREGFLNQGDAP